MEGLKLKGYVRSWQTDKDGKVVPGTVKEGHNAITDDLRYYLAKAIGADVSGEAISNLFASQTISSEDGKDGMAWGEAGGDINGIMVTTKNAGGSGGESYIEFYGTATASGNALTISPYLLLGINMSAAVPAFSKVYATYAINETVPDGRTYHFYWKISVS